MKKKPRKWKSGQSDAITVSEILREHRKLHEHRLVLLRKIMKLTEQLNAVDNLLGFTKVIP